MKILVALSGGVDSSVVAHLLHEQGHDLVGVMMKLWTDPLAPEVRRSLPTKCCSIEHIQRAREVCARLQIPFYLLNLEDEFKRGVVDPFLESYRQGDTPNPCIECNRTIKFGALMRKADELGCDMLATGHYARVVEREGPNGQYHALLEATDADKDQSYYLYTLSQETLSRVLFPLGDQMKQDVFTMAKRYQVPITSTYRESQDLCFFPEKEPQAFLRRYISDAQPGSICDEEGQVLGTHDGLPFYTVGQRRGLRIGGQRIPLYIDRKIKESNTIVVNHTRDQQDQHFGVQSLRWIIPKPSEKDQTMFARTRSLGEKRLGELKVDNDSGTFHFFDPMPRTATGQSVVFYRDEEVLGGGVITMD